MEAPPDRGNNINVEYNTPSCKVVYYDTLVRIDLDVAVYVHSHLQKNCSL